VDRRPSLLRHRVDADGNAVRITVGGEIDLSNSGQLESLFDEQVRAAGAGHQVLVDLSAVEFCAAVGARVLIEATRGARARGVELRLQRRSAAIDLVLDICGWQGEVEATDPTPPGAVRWLRRGTRT
jgi:anti-anti-sigma factor